MSTTAHKVPVTGSPEAVAAEVKARVTEPVDSARTLTAARTAAVKVGKAYGTAEGRLRGNLTDDAIRVTRDALRAGFLIDGRAEGKGTVNTHGFAALFGHRVTGASGKPEFVPCPASQVSFWRTMAKAWDIGITPDDKRWSTVKRAAKGKAVPDAIRKATTAEQVVHAVEAAGWDFQTGKRATAAKPRGVKDGVKPKDQSHAAMVKDAVQLLTAAFKGTTDQAAYIAMRKQVTACILAADTKHDVTRDGQPKPVTRKGTARRAAASAA